MRASYGRLKLFVLGAWASFFIWLIWSGQIYRYIGPRTRWVVTFGAVTLSLVAAGHAFLLKDADSRKASPREMFGLVVLLLPLLMVVIVPQPSLGSLAVSRKASGGFVAAGGLQPPAPEPGEGISFQEITYANGSEQYASDLGAVDGYEVELTGFVSGAPPSGNTFELSRFAVFCCAADAVPHTVSVLAREEMRYPKDTWLTVSGELFWDGGALRLRAHSVVPVDVPQDPYI